ncbi:MAG: 16S rRNA (guanine(966)-N(2))-methyltransferase RsmD [Rhodothermales bacterium]|nr:16S rRNA (guanine(966)-N(2))-methyltransferase RsmD [Rhodothermales bacterium]
MRVTGGRHRNRILVIPRGTDVRPTTDMSRQALFNRLASRTTIEGASVIDLFAGSGSLGIESLSRGAGSVTFVDSSRIACDAVEQNLTAVGEEDSVRVVQADVFSFLQQLPGTADIILADPPYALNNLIDLINASVIALSDGGYFVLEHDAALEFDEHPNFVVSGKYGRTKLSFFTSK